MSKTTANDEYWERVGAKMARNNRILQRIKATEKRHPYEDLEDIADVLDIEQHPTVDQWQQLRAMLVEQRDVLNRLIATIDRHIDNAIAPEQ